MTDKAFPEGFRHYPLLLEQAEQEALVEAIRGVVAEAPLFVPRMPRTGKAMSVRMSNCGPLGWVTDKDGGYRYQDHHPATKKPWPAMPEALRRIWDAVSGCGRSPQACLINFYDGSARMGLHQDRDEDDLSAPVVSVSLGDSCRFRIGTASRGGPTRSLELVSGAVVVLGGRSRLCYHGVDRIYPASSTLLKDGGRINLTLRRVTAVAPRLPATMAARLPATSRTGE